MKLANRTGVVAKLSGKRRNPWCAKVYVGKEWDEAGRTMRYRYKAIGYFPRKTDAYKALLQYHEDPVDNRSITLKQVYKEWSAIHYERIKYESIGLYENCWRYISALHECDIRKLKTIDIERAVEKADPPRTTRANIQLLLRMVYKYAMAHDYADKDYGALIDLRGDKTTVKIVRKVFTKEEVAELFTKQDVISDIMLVGIYTGMRPNELLSLKYSEVDGQFLRIAGSKTKSGLLRTIPIHADILQVLERNLAKSGKFDASEVFVYDDGKPVNSRTYARMMGDHTPHETRHTFITYAYRSGMDQLAVKKIVGHSLGTSVTETVYTHLDDEFLQREMGKYKVE